ncbi:hypothetical protein BDK51DRAFT_47743 [Blyttiomyces helicus]|uniref:Uncharacterized protein n=1 Tax=Blyttiomyces helicus TaxID=388810 RepID=A0A4P9W6S8_9FUNG|nr:hypothetical protein BDK51DRAFT_47743 [Blyttiomyces helicus]|eukprot:RKO85836.1 hypothetical protein BDK51DRAFT_47743 [Blyttiomyces helicus]
MPTEAREGWRTFPDQADADTHIGPHDFLAVMLTRKDLLLDNAPLRPTSTARTPTGPIYPTSPVSLPPLRRSARTIARSSTSVNNAELGRRMEPGVLVIVFEDDVDPVQENWRPGDKPWVAQVNTYRVQYFLCETTGPERIWMGEVSEEAGAAARRLRDVFLQFENHQLHVQEVDRGWKVAHKEIAGMVGSQIPLSSDEYPSPSSTASNSIETRNIQPA